MKISDEIREKAHELEGYLETLVTANELEDLAGRIDQELVELPKDAEGVPIRVGDTVFDRQSGERMHVYGMRYESQWGLRTDLGYMETSWLVRIRPDTFERIADDIEDFCADYEIKGDHEVFDRAMDFADRIRKLAAKKEGE